MDLRRARPVWYLQLPCWNKWKGVYFFLFSISAQSRSETCLTLENKFSVSNKGSHVEVVF